jgi:hypothetical protein
MPPGAPYPYYPGSLLGAAAADVATASSKAKAQQLAAQQQHQQFATAQLLAQQMEKLEAHQQQQKCLAALRVAAQQAARAASKNNREAAELAAMRTAPPQRAPSVWEAADVGVSETPPGEPTTVMLRNIPNRYTQSMLLTLLETHNYAGLYDFVYLPMDFRNGVNLGYAFVNLVRHPDALNFMTTFQGFSEWLVDSVKVCETSWAHPHQGLLEHVERYRNSPVMHPRMPDEYKPMVFWNGMRVAFPPPTKAIKAPKLRLTRERTVGPGAPGAAGTSSVGDSGDLSGLVSVCA